MKTLIPFLALLLSGCATSREIAVIKHADGSGETRYKYIAAGGIIRPGVIVVVVETIGSNAPVVLTQASGAPLAGNVLGVASGAAAGFLAGYGIGKNNEHGDTTTVIHEAEQRTTPPPIPSRPPFGPPPWHGHHPNNRGH